MSKVEIGNFVKSVCGRDKGNIYLVINIENDRLLLVNGDERKLANPKIKNTKHIEIVDFDNTTLKNKILAKQKVFDAEIYSAIKKIIQGKGEFNG